MNSLIRTNATLVWAILSSLTVVSWALGTSHGFGGDNHVPASIVIFVVAVFKIRLVGSLLHGTSGRADSAPRHLRGLLCGAAPACLSECSCSPEEVARSDTDRVDLTDARGVAPVAGSRRRSPVVRRF